MTLIDSIRTTLRTVVGSASGLGEAWSYRTITSAPTVQTVPTWSNWAATTGLITNEHISETADPKTGKLSRRTQAFLRVPDTLVLAPGSQVSPDQTVLWSVIEPISSGAGTIRYLIGRDVIERGQAARGGGV